MVYCQQCNTIRLIAAESTQSSNAYVLRVCGHVVSRDDSTYPGIILR